jgi:hypothetical protein
MCALRMPIGTPLQLAANMMAENAFAIARPQVFAAEDGAKSLE